MDNLFFHLKYNFSGIELQKLHRFYEVFMCEKLRSMGVRKMRRVLCLVLACLMLLGLFPMQALGATVHNEEIMPQSLPFGDVSSNDWFYSYVSYVHQNGIMSGTSATAFAPHVNFSRAMVVTTLFRIHNGRQANNSDPRNSTFSDVPHDSWYAPYVSWAQDNGIAQGIGNNRFAPQNNVSRQEFATLLYRFADQMTDRDTTIRQSSRWNNFTDLDQIQEWAVDGLIWANYYGIINGRTSTTIVPNGVAIRAEAATMLMRFNNSTVFHYIYRSDVTVISNTPAYSVTEAESGYIVTVYQPNDAILQLTTGDTFAFEPTEQNPDGIAGHITSIAPQGTNLIITVKSPESLEEIFYEFEFIGDIDLLSQEIEFDTLAWNEALTPFSQIEPLSGLPVNIRTTSQYIEASIRESNWQGVTVGGSVRLYMPRLQMSANLDDVSYMVITTTVQSNIRVSSGSGLNRVIPLGQPIGIRPMFGVHVAFQLGLRINANGQFSIEVMCRAETEFGIRNNRPVTRATVTYNATADLSASVAVSANLRAMARFFRVGLYGIQGDFGLGARTSSAMQRECPTGRCTVIELFHVRNISSLTDWGVLRSVPGLRFTADFAPPNQPGFRFRSGGAWHTSCPCQSGTPPTASIDLRDLLGMTYHQIESQYGHLFGPGSEPQNRESWIDFWMSLSYLEFEDVGLRIRVSPDLTNWDERIHTTDPRTLPADSVSSHNPLFHIGGVTVKSSFNDVVARFGEPAGSNYGWADGSGNWGVENYDLRIYFWDIGIQYIRLLRPVHDFATGGVRLRAFQ